LWIFDKTFDGYSVSSLPNIIPHGLGAKPDECKIYYVDKTGYHFPFPPQPRMDAENVYTDLIATSQGHKIQIKPGEKIRVRVSVGRLGGPPSSVNKNMQSWPPEEPDPPLELFDLEAALSSLK